MSIANKHIADNNFFSFSKTAHWHILHATLSKPLTSLFWPMTPTAQMWLVNPTEYKI